MKKILFALAFLTILGCVKDDFITEIDSVIPQLEIEGAIGMKFYSSNISDTDMFNIKSPDNSKYSILITDVFGNLVAKSTIKAKAGNNVYAFYTRAFKEGHYTISLYKDGKEIQVLKQQIL
tara:strand:- start:789 stop:1151 length:363 start_codon:yes stop_codon:yes gene_type:complete